MGKNLLLFIARPPSLSFCAVHFMNSLEKIVDLIEVESRMVVARGWTE
jgi:hypothetical protein